MPAAEPARAPREIPPILAALVLAALIAALAAACVLACGGRLVFALDDAYIHLSLARGIAHGTYGIEPGEPAAPSSSPLWPFLLVPAVLTAQPEIVVLLLAAAAAILTAGLFQALARRAFPAARAPAAIALAVCLSVSANLPALVMTGMEHTLQALLAVAAIWALVRFETEGTLPSWTVPALVLGPLVRYESLALTMPIAVLLFLRGRKRAAVAIALGALVPLALFSVFLKSRGLGWLPSSVEAKLFEQSVALTGWGAVRHWVRVRLAAEALPRLALIVLVLALPRSRREGGLVAAAGIACVVLHVAFGNLGWFGRYEAYALAAGLAAVVFSARGLLAAAAKGPALALVTVAFGWVAWPYLVIASRAPAACQGMLGQPVQTARFVRDYWKRPVGVNDLGYVSWAGGERVVDLWGLGSREALLIRLRHQGFARLDALCRNHGVRLAAVYGSFFPHPPPSWREVGRTTLTIPNWSLASPVVTFFALDEEAAREA
ncbi:MAG TPA: hypothetical protein VGR00_15255, partial [Thermoanaerobaculia bacterium]|nr:hypothetical protein [Thermoanaerobaculia bacterium]